MDNSTALRMTIGIVLIVTIVVITLLVTTSLSVGGTVYRSESETCSSCHIEVPYVQGYQDTPHEEGNVTCMDCHQYRSPITDAQCLTCHQDYDLSNKTQFEWLYVVEPRVIDSHAKTPHVSAKCTTCHIEHEFELGVPKPVTQSICRNCHTEYRPGQR